MSHMRSAREVIMAVVDPVSEVLGIRASGPLPLMSAVEKGLPLTSLDRVVHSVAPSDNKFAFRIIARATLARRRKALVAAKDRAEGRLSAEEGARLARLAGVWAWALEHRRQPDDLHKRALQHGSAREARARQRAHAA